MNSIKSSEIKKPTSPKASGQSRAGCYSTEGAWVSVYEAALHGVALMAGPVTPRCECASKCRLYPWCCADWHLCGLGGVGGDLSQLGLEEPQMHLGDAKRIISSGSYFASLPPRDSWLRNARHFCDFGLGQACIAHVLQQFGDLAHG